MKIKSRWIISLTKLAYFAIICIAVIRAMRFHVQPWDNMDLARHMYMMELIKKSNYSLLEYVFIHGDAFTSNISMKFCYLFNLIVYLVAKHCKNYYIISWLFVFFDYCIIAYMGVDWWRSNGGRRGLECLYEILICFSLLPFFQAVSGLRTAMAACIMMLALYYYLYKEKSFVKFCLLALLSATTHPAFITAMPFAIVAKTVDRKKGLVLSVAGSGAVSAFANIFIKSSNGFLYGVAFKYLQYTGEGGYRSTRFCYYGVIFICILTILIYFYVFIFKREDKGFFVDNKGDHIRFRIKIYDFIVFYMFFVLSNIGAYEMVVRPAYLLGAMAPVITGLVFGTKNQNRKEDGIIFFLQTMLVLLLIYVSFMYLIWHREYFV